jgi:hypothetical protein
MNSTKQTRTGVITALAVVCTGTLAVLYTKVQTQADATTTLPASSSAGFIVGMTDVTDDKIKLIGNWPNGDSIQMDCGWQWNGSTPLLDNGYTAHAFVQGEAEDVTRFADGIMEIHRDLKLEDGGTVSDQATMMDSGSIASQRCDTDAVGYQNCVPIANLKSQDEMRAKNKDFLSYCATAFADPKTQDRLKLYGTSPADRPQHFLSAPLPVPQHTLT